VDARRIENHFIHPANYHSRCEIFNESVTAFLAQVNRYNYPEYEYLVVDYQENAEEDGVDRPNCYFRELFVEEETLSNTLVILGKHVVGDYYQHVSEHKQVV
jgi:hypothetical protein